MAAVRNSTRGTSPSRIIPPILLGVFGLLILLAMGNKWNQKRAAETVASEELVNIVPLKSEEQFISQMIPYNLEAIESSRFIMDRTQNPDLKEYATDTINKRTKEIWTMLGLYQQWYGNQYSETAGYMKLMPDLTKLSGQELEKAYLRSMIDHHLGAIEMSKIMMGQSDKDNVKAFADQLSKAHTSEMEKLKGWLEKYPQ